MKVLFVCVQNAGRSQIAEALFEREASGRHVARSAGSRPAERVHPEVVEAMGELGVDVSGRIPRTLDRSDLQWADRIVTMGCGDECPVLPGKRYEDWELPDPAGATLEVVRALREEIGKRVRALVAELDAAGESLVSAQQERDS